MNDQRARKLFFLPFITTVFLVSGLVTGRAIAGDRDGTGGYKFKMYEEELPGDVITELNVGTGSPSGAREVHGSAMDSKLSDRKSWSGLREFYWGQLIRLFLRSAD